MHKVLIVTDVTPCFLTCTQNILKWLWLISSELKGVESRLIYASSNILQSETVAMLVSAQQKTDYNWQNTYDTFLIGNILITKLLFFCQFVSNASQTVLLQKQQISPVISSTCKTGREVSTSRITSQVAMPEHLGAALCQTWPLLHRVTLMIQGHSRAAVRRVLATPSHNSSEGEWHRT